MVIVEIPSTNKNLKILILGILDFVLNVKLFLINMQPIF
jgi:hypothetical protein